MGAPRIAIRRKIRRTMKGFGPVILLFSGLLLTVKSLADETLGAMNSITAEVLIKADASWNGHPLPPYSAGDPEISIVRVTIPAGSSLPLHIHPYATAGVLLQGRLEVRTPGGETLEVHPGDGVIELINQPHAGANTGTEDAVILVVYAGIKGQPVTELVLE